MSSAIEKTIADRLGGLMLENIRLSTSGALLMQQSAEQQAEIRRLQERIRALEAQIEEPKMPLVGGEAAGNGRAH